MTKISNFQAISIISIYTITLLFLVSPDSFTHDIFTCCDTPIFYLCGKAWMNGMVPYVDFTDSKGPLLWLIQGIGYMISHYNYIGVFFISCIAYFFVFYYEYKIFYIFINNRNLSVICTMIMGAVFFNPWYHYEIKCEDWCQPFIVIVVYRICLLLYNEDVNTKTINLTAFVLGVSFAGPLLIKYSIAAMIGIFIITFYYYLIKEKVKIITPSFYFLSGVLIISIPFIIYFYFLGNLYDFVNEYFFTTFKTIGDSNTINTFVHEIFLTFADPKYTFLFSLSFIGALLFARNNYRYRYIPLMWILYFWLISIHHATNYYYLTSNFVFISFFIIDIIKAKQKDLPYYHNIKIGRIGISIIVFVTFWNYTFTNGYLLSNLFFFNNNFRETYYKAAYVLSQVKDPKIVYLDCAVHGWGTPVNTLPGSKYFFTQYGETKAMRDKRHQDILNRLPDFICMEEANIQNDAIEIVNKAGYKLCYEFNWWHHHFYFYTKHKKVTPPLADLKISNKDILFKKKIFEE